MPRIRSTPPEICEDEALASVSAYAERTLHRLQTHCDDDGRSRDDAKLLAARLYPLHDKVTPEHVERDLSELAQAGLLERYEVGGKRFLAIDPEFWSAQKPRRRVASKLPPPPPPDNDGTRADIVGTPPAGGGGEGRRRSETEGESEGEATAAARDPQPVGNRGPWDPVVIQHSVTPRLVTAAELEARAAARAASARERPA